MDSVQLRVIKFKLKKKNSHGYHHLGAATLLNGTVPVKSVSRRKNRTDVKCCFVQVAGHWLSIRQIRNDQSCVGIILYIWVVGNLHYIYIHQKNLIQ